MKLLFRAFDVEDWKKGIALVILWSYAYQLCVWPAAWWLMAFANSRGILMPLPPLLPWEQLVAGTTTLAAVGGIQAVRDRWSGDPPPAQP